MYLFGLSQPQLTRTKLLWLCLCLFQLTFAATSEQTSDQKDNKLESKGEASKLSEIDAYETLAKNLDLELLSRTGDEENRERSDNDPLREILNAEESAVKEIKVEPSAELLTELKSKLESSTKPQELKSENSKEESTKTTSPGGLTTPATVQSTNLTTISTDQLAKESAPVASLTGDKQASVVDSKKSIDKVTLVSEKPIIEKKSGHSIEDKDPLTSASSNVDNVKNEERKLLKSDEITSEEKLTNSDKIESKEIDELKATHRESDSRELNIEESSKLFVRIDTH